jgi:asparagine synthase (glutamine-hydrolysing)
MCGIAGYVGQQEIEPERIRQALALMGRRGPDHAAHEHLRGLDGRHIHLLHSRLRIIDLDPRSNQPFHRGPLTVVFNGQLYNFVELRASLERRGKSFATTSDTEVLAAALEEDGQQALDRFEGMWSFAVYDERDGSLLLSRDRFGEKPLYIMEREEGLYFASEPKCLAALCGQRLLPNQAQILRYLVNGYKSLYKSGQTFFQGVSELPAASVLRLETGGKRTQTRYWEPRFAPDESMTREEAVEEARTRLLRAVEIRLRADVPLAFCMSGGIDSNTIIAIAKKVLGYDVHGFTIENSDARYEERDMVEHSKTALDLRHNTVSAKGQGSLASLRELVRYHDAPVYTISYFLHWLLMKSVAEYGYRVSVSGTAADEIFTGYFDHHLQYLWEVREDRARHDAYLQAWTEHVKPVVRNPFLSNPRLFVDDVDFRGHIYLDAAGFSDYLRVPFQEPFSEHRFTTESLLRNRTLNELFFEAVPVILHEDDLNAMYWSIENRSPFLDRPLFEFALRVPVRHLMRDGLAKAILRDAMRGIVPDAILDNRRKVGFNAPIADVLDLADPSVREVLLDDSPIFDLVRRESIQAVLARDFLPNSQSKFLFYFACSKMFLEEFGR